MTGCIIYDEPEAVYYRRELGVANHSGLKILDSTCPARYYHYCTHPEDDKTTDALEFGRALDTAILEPHTFASTYCVLPEDAPNRPTQRQIHAKKPAPATIAQIDWWAQWDADHVGMIDLDAADMDQIHGMAASLRNHVVKIPDSDGVVQTIRIDELLALCRRQVTRRWIDPRTGIACKSRSDLDCEEFAFGGDLKSAIDASPEGFARAVHAYRYHQQHVHYCDGAQATGSPWQNFLFFVIEKTKPYVPAVYYIPAMAEERGRFLRDRALDTLKRCLESNTWPGYTDTLTELILPAYAYYD